MIKLPDFVTKGEMARLIPVVADTGWEQHGRNGGRHHFPSTKKLFS